MDDIEDTFRQASLGEDVGEDELGARRDLARFEDGDVATDDGLDACPLRQYERRVPRCTAEDDSVRAASDVCRARGAESVVVAEDAERAPSSRATSDAVLVSTHIHVDPLR